MCEILIHSICVSSASSVFFSCHGPVYSSRFQFKTVQNLQLCLQWIHHWFSNDVQLLALTHFLQEMLFLVVLICCFLCVQDLQEHEAEEQEQETMAIFVTGNEDPLQPRKDIKIVIEGTQVLNEVPSVTTAVAMLFGLTYALNIKYPKNMQYTLEFVHY